LALTKKRTYAEIVVNYGEADRLTLILNRDDGMAIRSQLETATGKTGEMPERK
jgi:hypothetical protein